MSLGKSSSVQNWDTLSVYGTIIQNETSEMPIDCKGKWIDQSVQCQLEIKYVRNTEDLDLPLNAMMPGFKLEWDEVDNYTNKTVETYFSW